MKRSGVPALLLVLIPALFAIAQPLDTAFTYQGELRSAGVPASGAHDMRFRLYDTPGGGAQVGSTLCSDNVPLSEGRFTVVLDFGSVFAGQQRFLEIEVRADTGLDCSNPAGFVILGPRQPLTGAPNALFSLTAGSATTATTAANASQLNGQPASFYQNASNLTSGTLPTGLLGGAYTGALTFSNAGNVLAGSGAGLTGLSASNVTAGTLADARLSGSVALLNAAQTFSASKTFSTAPSFTAGDTPFIVSGSGLVTNLNADRLDGLDSSAFLQSIPVPLTLSGTNPTSHIISGTNAATTGNSYGVYGRSTSGSNNTYGVYGRCDSPDGAGVGGYASSQTGNPIGVWGTSAASEGYGVLGDAVRLSGTTTGVWGRSISTGGRGVFGSATATSGTTYGVWGQSASTDGTGVIGVATAATGTTYGVYARSDSTSGRAVYGRALATSGDARGVYGISDSTAGTGVTGEATAASGATFGGYFESNSTSGYGVYGRNSATTGTIYGVRGYASTAAGGYAVYAAGDMGASGVKPFRIDHPQDPENKYLLHYAAESPEVINFYRGTATLDGRGEALVELPAYFGSINKDPSYQLTAVGAPMPMLYVAEKISAEALAAGEKAGPGEAVPLCSFRIAGGVPGGEVSWRIEAVRNDLRMRLHGAPVEREKTGPERGKYQHPEYYGRPPERGMDVRQPGNHDQPTEVER